MLAFAVLLALAGCETSPLGGRCTNNFDCDRNATGAVTQCVRSSNAALSCGNSELCICCPIDRTNDAGVPITCFGGTVVVDSGTSPDVVVDTGTIEAAADVVSDVVAEDTGPVTCSCPAGQFCNDVRDASTDTGPTCQPLRAIGVVCMADGQCQTSHCTDGVCCNSACTGAGLSCNSSPDFSGLCMPIATTDASVTDASLDAAAE
ncbi:MAG: hypothetical protein WCJ30_15545 [Deltaproteobacteria bacterium]